MNITVSINGLDKLRQAFKAYPERSTREYHLAISSIIEKIQGDAMKNAPVNKGHGGGNLRQSIAARMIAPVKGVVVVGAKYAEFVHEGTRPHIIRVRSKRILAAKRRDAPDWPWSSKKGYSLFGKKVNHPGTIAVPFLRDAVESNQTFIQQRFDQALENILR